MHFSFSKSNEEKNSLFRNQSLYQIDRKQHQEHQNSESTWIEEENVTCDILLLGYRSVFDWLGLARKIYGLTLSRTKTFSLLLTSLFHLLFLFHSLNASRYQAYTKEKKNKHKNELNNYDDDDNDKIENGGSVQEETHRQTRACIIQNQSHCI